MKVSKYFFEGFIFALITSLFLIPTEVKAERFSVTGYYSPLPKQEFYLTGSYESELSLNGQGIAGADGTEVFYGMIAAPNNYKFGTNICLEKLGCGTVHDRGGAIVNKGERKKANHDRIDFWMGYGMDGLKRSLLWGRQDIKGKIIGKNVDRSKSGRAIKMSPTILEIMRQKTPENIFNENLYPGTNESSVKRLKDSLVFLNLFKEDVDTKYDENLKKAVMKFQQKYKIINNDSDYGAGNFGPKTREKMDEIIRLKIDKKLHSQWSNKVFEENLGYTDHGIDVYRLQQLLYDNKFLEVSPTGFFGNKTRKAVVKFQIKYNLVDTASSIDAGNIGPKTRKKLTEMWLKKRDALFVLPKQEIIKEIKLAPTSPDKIRLIIQDNPQLTFPKDQKAIVVTSYFNDSVILFRGKRSEDVRKLQKSLKKLGFFTGKTTGFYGDETAEAVLAFQFKHKIVDSRRSIGASIFGPGTRTKMNEIM